MEEEKRRSLEEREREKKKGDFGEEGGEGKRDKRGTARLGRRKVGWQVDSVSG